MRLIVVIRKGDPSGDREYSILDAENPIQLVNSLPNVIPEDYLRLVQHQTVSLLDGLSLSMDHIYGASRVTIGPRETPTHVHVSIFP